MREYIDSIPDLLEEQQEVIDRVLAHYELIDDFYYNLSNDDFAAKWTTLAWPSKIRNLVEEIEQNLEEDEERFRKLQIADLASFSDKIDSLTVGFYSILQLKLFNPFVFNFPILCSDDGIFLGVVYRRRKSPRSS